MGGLSTLLVLSSFPSAHGQAANKTIQSADPASPNRVVWLILRGGEGYAIPTASYEECEVAGAEFISSKRFSRQQGIDWRGFECLNGVR